MRGRSAALGALLALIALGGSIAAVGVASMTAAKKKTPVVLVADDYFSPTSLKIKKKTKVKFKWSSNNINTHDVQLDKGPKGVKKGDFRSGSAATNYKFTPKFVKPGTYDLLCSLHPDVMQIEVKVKR